MRLCAALALSVAGAFALAPGAGASTYCPSAEGPPDCVWAASPQQALNMAAAHPGFDTVALGSGTYDVGAGLVYTDDGSADNGVRIENSTRCPDRYTCNEGTLRGGAPGTAVLTLRAPGGSEVSVVGARLQAEGGASGLVLGRGARAQGGSVTAPDAPGIVLEGTESAPALVQSTFSTGTPALDAPGHGIVRDASLTGEIGVRVRGEGNADIRGGSILATTGVTGTHARITGTAVTFGERYSVMPNVGNVGVEAACPDAASADAGIEITNATIVIRHGEFATGVRAAARGGDGESCDASVSMSSTIVWGAEHSLDARGEPGSGADPRAGTARIAAAYSDFKASATRQTAPAQLDTSSPGGNLDTEPQFAGGGLLPNYPLLWTSPLINAGDPAPPAEWQRPYVDVVHGRRDIGEVEYGFRRPTVEPGIYPGKVATGTMVSLYAGASDNDPGDQLELMWTLPDRSTAQTERLERTFHAAGRYRFHIKATDPTGQVAEADATVRVVEQRISDLRVRPSRFRAERLRAGSRAAQILFDAAAYGKVRFKVQRAVRRPGSSRVRWRRVPGRYDYSAWAFEDLKENSVPFTRWFGRGRPRPGLYRLIATPLSDGTGARTRFRIVR